jgi:hypothetical protein
MDGFGDFLGGLFREAVGAAADGSWEAPDVGYDSTMPEAGQGGRVVAAQTYERYLAGGPRDLNINDL